ncbi:MULTISPECIES: dihydrolipoyl dehydrogenase [Limnochorda]|uniref:dihydrolipoyl dehydrogenase n=1 Tax=Limnochorda TaxID=1676651 RepID=UPI00185128FB|nr:dihydrolipoyl dehydrogenase [Limnochorda pilosa]MBO2485530.1 dihydrolipoyl dehydrogenase [Bacillota bacterium]MBO2518672.1 dihydrolipoyl dehydrogenase [Bacillota bacterium]NMA70622.1 dihydrolipoyl dehydrogenase [Bacillota bacterium]
MAERFDLVVVGGGPGGYVGAIRARQLGLRVALVEQEHLGGVCLNWGCIPTKSLLHTAEVLRRVQEAGRYGIETGPVSADFGKAIDLSRQAAQRLAKGVSFLMRKNGVHVVEGRGRLAGPDRVVVEPSGEELVADKILLATGGRPRSLPGVELDGELVLSSRHALSRRELPGRVVIVGGGAIGVEFASIYRTYGAQVTVLEMLPHLLPNEEPELAQALERAFQRQGIQVRTGVRVAGLARHGGQVHLTLEGEAEPLEADMVLMAVGTQPNSENLGLEELGIETDRGFVKVNEHMETTRPGIYAVGDLVGPPMLAHVASEEAVVAVEHMAGRPVPRLQPERMPRATYCEPQVASVGLTEAQARERGYEVVTGVFPLQANGKAVALQETGGLVKVVGERRYGQVLGVHLVGPQVTEILAEAGLAVNMETTLEELGGTVHAHPTIAEAVREAALAALGRAIHI